jgi:hypothetical protein
MEKLFYFILVLTLINFSTQFFFDSETDEFDAEPNPPPNPNPVVKRCGDKILNKTETKDCIQMAIKHWYPNTNGTNPTIGAHKMNLTDCCYTWDTIHCYLKIYEKVCTQEEVKEANDYLKVVLNYVESDYCKSWPFKEDQQLCHSK